MTLTLSPECSFEIDPEKLTAALEGQLITAPGSYGTRDEARRVAMQMVNGIRRGIEYGCDKVGNVEELKQRAAELKFAVKDLSDASINKLPEVAMVLQERVAALQKTVASF